MNALAMFGMLMLGFAVGFAAMGLMVMAKDREPERAGAAVFAFEVLDRLAARRHDPRSFADASFHFESDIQSMCEKAIERAEDHEFISGDLAADSTNG